MSSTRLPGKVLEQLEGRSLLEWVVRAAKQSGVCKDIVVATSTDKSDDPIVGEAERLDVNVSRGEMDDVLSRFLGALSVQPDEAVFVRLTADCPLLDPDLIAMCVRSFEKASVDYVSTILSRSLPRGLDVEVSTVRALREIDSFATGYQRAHVTPAIYENPQRFSLAGIFFEPPASDLRVTVDTEDDLEAVTQIVEILGDSPPRWKDLVELLRDRPDLASINAHIVQKDLAEG